MKLNLVLVPLFAFVVVSSAFANDGGFYANGATLVPVQSTSIRMAREDLHLKRKGNECLITVKYLFINEGPDTTIDVGFVTSAPMGDVQIDDGPGIQHQIKKMKVSVNGKSVTGKWRTISNDFKEDEFKPDNFEKVVDLAENLDEFTSKFAYLFKAKFPRGHSYVTHSYRYRMSSSVMYEYGVEYTLVSGKLWKGGQIDTFNLTIDMGDTTIVGIQQGFGDWKSVAPWKIAGDAEAIDTFNVLENDTSYPNYTVYVVGKSKFELNMLSFAPDQDLSVIIFSERRILDEIADATSIRTLGSTRKALAIRAIDKELAWNDDADDRKKLLALRKRLK